MNLKSDTLRFLKKWLLPVVMGFALMRALVAEVYAQTANATEVDWQMTAKELKPLVDLEQYRIIEVSKVEEYEAGHIPMALHAWRPDYASKDFDFSGVKASVENIEALMGRLGILPDHSLVLYDEKGNVNAARLRWILKEYGHPGHIFLLEGGKQAWKKMDTLEKHHPIVQATEYHFPNPPSMEDPTGLEFVRNAYEAKNKVLLDVRSEAEYRGTWKKKGASRAGHIPGAKWLDYHAMLRFDEDGNYLGIKSKAEILEMAERAGFGPEDELIAYCHSGVRSALAALILEKHVGFRSVKNYDGSWTEWSFFAELPVDTGLPEPVVLAAGPTGGADYGKILKESYSGFWDYLVAEISFNYEYKPKWQNFFWGLLAVSLFFFGLEIIKPWRPNQPRFRKDFWLDFFYMYFNFFLFGLIIFAAAQNVLTQAFNDFLGLFGIENIVAVQINELPVWAYFLILFVVADFIQWNVHRLLHRVPWLWEFHKVHHSVEQMGFAAHLRYHWMENIVYKSIQAIPLTMLGFNLVDLFILHFFNLTWGHFNHSNITVKPRVSGTIFGALIGLGIASLYALETYQWPMFIAGGGIVGFAVFGPFMHYIFNSPEMHLWHHAWELPEDKPYGMNFGLTLACWDWIFGTVHWPHDKGDVKLGFEGLEEFPKGFFGQLVYGFGRKKKQKEKL